MLRPIFLVDDSEFDEEFALRALAECGLKNPVVTAHDGQQALHLLKANLSAADELTYALIIVDIKLPLLDGFELLKYIKSIPEFSATPVIVQTGSMFLQERLRALELGASGFVKKTENLREYARDLCSAIGSPPGLFGPAL